MRSVPARERAAVSVHDTAIVDPAAELATGVDIGPYAIIGPGVSIGANSRVGPRVLIERDTTLGTDCRIANGAVLGTDPQDLKYEGEDTILEIGDRTVIREFATLNRGTAASGRTLVGSDCLLMAYCHIAHDCELGNHVIVSNATNMAGHVVHRGLGGHQRPGGDPPVRPHRRPFAFVGGGVQGTAGMCPRSVKRGRESVSRSSTASTPWVWSAAACRSQVRMSAGV